MPLKSSQIAIPALTCVALLFTSGFAADAGVKQPVFLICPSTAEYSALSIYVVVDRNDHSKVLSLGLETLTGKNSSGSTYESVLAAQHDPKTDRKILGTLESKKFGSSELTIEQDDALHIAVTPETDGSLDIMCSVRVGSSDRFTIGGKEKTKRSVALKFDPSTKLWSARVIALTDSNGAKIPGARDRTITGMLFPVTATGIYRVAVAFDDGTGVRLLDR